VWKGYAISSDEIKRLASAFPIQQTGIVSYWKMDEARAAKSFIASGSAQIDTAQFKFGTSSGLFNGTTDYVTGPTSVDFDFGTGDYTTEAWVRFSAVNTNRSIWSTSGSRLYFDNTNTNIYVYEDTGAAKITAAWSGSINTWYHVAVCRTSGNTKLFIDGTQVGSTYVGSTNITGTGNMIIGQWYNLSGFYMNGWIDELRISNSSRYPNNFTAPTSAFTADDRTSLLMHFEGSDGSTTFTDSSASGSGTPATLADAIGSNNLTTANSPVQVVGMSGNATDFEKDSTQNATISDGSQVGLGITGEFSLSSWVKLESTGATFKEIMSKYTGSTGYSLRITSSDTVELYINSGNGATTSTLVSGRWYFITAIYSGASGDIYIDGVIAKTFAHSTNPTNSGTSFGVAGVGGSYMDGILDESIVLKRYFRPEEIKVAYINGLNDNDITYEPVSGNTGGFFAIL